MDRKKIELKVEFEEHPPVELLADSYDMMMQVSEPFQLPIDKEWKMSIILYSAGPPTRVYITYDVENEELKIVEKRKKEKHDHSLPALATGGPIPIRHVLDWMQYGLALVQEWIEW